MWRGGSGPDKCVGRSGGPTRTWRRMVGVESKGKGVEREGSGGGRGR